MTIMRSSSGGLQNRPRIGRARENGMQSVSRITRLTVAVSLMLSAVFSVIAAIGFSGRANAGIGGSSATTTTNGSSTSVRLALPPKGDGSVPIAPVAPPISQPVAQAPPPITSGGS
jgi:hypothetical protein